MKLVWDGHAFDDYLWWQSQDRKVLRRINALIKDIERTGNAGIGKPELHNPGGPTCIVDDCTVDDTERWSTIGVDLLRRSGAARG